MSENGLRTSSAKGCYKFNVRSRGPGCCLAALSTECSLWRVRDLIYGTIGRLFLLRLLCQMMSSKISLMILLDILEIKNFIG